MPVPRAKVQAIREVLMVAEVLVIIKQEVMADIMVVFMPPKVEPNVLGVMTNGKPKSRPTKVFESSDD